MNTGLKLLTLTAILGGAARSHALVHTLECQPSRPALATSLSITLGQTESEPGKPVVGPFAKQKGFGLVSLTKGRLTKHYGLNYQVSERSTRLGPETVYQGPFSTPFGEVKGTLSITEEADFHPKAQTYSASLTFTKPSTGFEVPQTMHFDCKSEAL